MRKSASDVKKLKARIGAVRKNFGSEPSFKWLPVFRATHTQYSRDRIRNVYYMNSTDEDITEALEKFWIKHKPQSD